MNPFTRLLAVLAFAIALAATGRAQYIPTPGNVNTNRLVAGDPRFDAFSGGPDIVDLGSLDVHLDIPLVHQKGRGIDFDYRLSFDSLYQPYPNSYNWRFIAGGGTGGYLTFSQVLIDQGCTANGGQPTSILVGAFLYVDGSGTPHPFSNSAAITDCEGTNVYGDTVTTPSSTGFPAYALDGSGIQLVCPTCVTGGAYQPVVQLPSGVIVSSVQLTADDPAPENPDSNEPAPYFQDNNGNYIYWTGYYSEIPDTGEQNYVDTLGNTVLATTFTPPGQNYQIWDGAGTVVKSYSGGSYTVIFSNDEAQSIAMPDGRSYSFTYGTQVLPGLNSSNLTSITLPGGGTITYSANTDGSYGFTRTVTDAMGHTSVWKYSQIDQINPATEQGTPSYGVETTVTDPLGNQTVYGFSADVTAFPQIPTIYPDNYTTSYEWTSKTSYSGLASSGTVLESSTQLWDYQDYSGGEYGVEVNTTVYGANNSQKTSALNTVYNSTGQVVESDAYDYGVAGGGHGILLGKTMTSYAALSQILDHPASVSQYDGLGNLVSETTYGYSELAIATSNTPNHTTPSGSRGNVSLIQKYTSGSAAIEYGASYYDTGRVAATSGGSSPYVAYMYGQCGNSYPTAVTETISSSVSLSTSTSWNCSSGEPISQTDVNGNTTSMGYDGFGRPTSIVDPAGNTTTMTYPTASSNVSTVTQAFVGGVPSQYSQTKYDGLGRPILSQTRQGPSGTTYSSVAQVYDLDGRATWTSTPYSATAGTYTTTGAGTKNMIDAAGRLFFSTDPGGGTTSYTYNLNDVSITTGPVVTGENAKTRTLEYDGAGRLSSVCEVTSMTGSGSCGQSTTGSGFLTAYTYHGQVAGIAQNSQAGSTKAQTRTISYDLLGRATSQQMPETGTSTFVYDGDASGVCPGSYPGSLVKSTDNAGNVQCMTYDGAGRVLSTQTVAGIYSTLTPQTHYVYDAASLNGTAMQNVKGAVAEEYTCTGACTTKLTDIFNSSYYEVSGGQKTGRTISQTWESTPHSSNYFTSQSISYANGAPAAIGASLSGTSIGFPAITYGLDTFGRPWTVSDSTNSLALVSGTGYNNLTNSVTGITFGNTDSEAYGYDPATNRPTAVNYSVKSSTPLTIASSLTWNPNASLKNFTLSDSSDSSKNQNCNYAMDDLNRLASVNCASSWAQSFTYDPFGNIAKGPISNPGTGQFSQTYAAGYSNLTNQANSGVTAVYDKNGNQTQAEANTMTFNAAGQAIAVNNVVGTYDAAGRVVETGGSMAAVPATVSTGSISLSGTEGVIPTTNNYQATATVTLTGTLKSETINPQTNPHPNGCGDVVDLTATTATCYDVGGGTVVVNVISLASGQSIAADSYGVGYEGPSDTFTSLATTLAASVNGMTSETGVSATSSGGTVTLTMKEAYPSGVGFVVSGGLGCSGAIFNPCSFTMTTAPQGMITGNYVSTTSGVYDSGTVTAAISTLPVATYTYGSSDTPSTIAAGLAASINSKDSASATAVATTVHGVATVQVSSKATGYGINWPIALSTTYNTSSFKAPSFGGTTTNVAGGYNAVAGTTGGTSYTQFVYSPSGAKIAVVQNGALVKGTVPLPGGGSAIYSSAGLKYIRHKDWLGSSRLATTWAHGVYSKTAYAPFGESYNQAGTTDLSFTGEDQDTSAGVYDFQFRKFDPIAGRWMSPDPSGLAYADPTNPQSLNMYTYVLNNPLSLVDPNGLDCVYYQDDGAIEEIIPGDCKSDDDDGQYIDGTITSYFYNSDISAYQFQAQSLDNAYNFIAFSGQITLSWGGDDASVSTGTSDAQNTPATPNAPNNAPSNQILPCLVKGALVGAATAVVVGTVATLAAPVVGAGVVSAALFAGAVYGGYTLYKDISSNYSSGNTAGLAYDAGSLLGGAAVGYFRGGATANGIKPGASSGWSLSRDISNRFKPSLGLNPLTWFGTGPDAGAAGGAQAAAGQAVPRRGC